MDRCAYYRDDKRLDGNILDLSVPFRVNCAGYDITERTLIYKYVRKDYYLQLMDKGCLLMDEDEKRFYPQQFIIHSPEKMTTYKFTNPGYQYYWIHFTGSCVDHLLDTCNLVPDRIYTISDGAMLKASQLFASIYDEFILQRHGWNTIVSSRCQELVAQLYRGTAELLQPSTELRLRDCLRYIHSHISSDLTVEDLARMENISASHLRGLFQKAFHCSPRAYITRIRLEKASALLPETNLRISEIAFSCGFSDPLYFSRLFTKKYGMSPSEYRKHCYAYQQEQAGNVSPMMLICP